MSMLYISKIQKLFIEIIFFIFSTTRFNSLKFFYVWAFYCFRKICLHFDNFERTLNSGGYEGRSDRGPLNSKGSLKFKMSNKFKIKNIIPSLTSLVNLRNVQRQEVKHHRFQPQHHVQRHKRVPKNKHIKSRAILQYQK